MYLLHLQDFFFNVILLTIMSHLVPLCHSYNSLPKLTHSQVDIKRLHTEDFSKKEFDTIAV